MTGRGMVDGQLQEIWEPGFEQKKEKLCVGLMQLGQDLGEKLMRTKGVCSQILPRKGELIHHQGPRFRHWRHNG